MKSYILNNIRKTDGQAVDDATLNNKFNKAYRNMIDKDSFKLVNDLRDLDTVSPLPNFPASNIEEDTNTKEVRYIPSYQTSVSQREYFIALEPNKEDSESYDSLVINFNKLDKQFLDAIRNPNNSFDAFIIFSDDPDYLGRYEVDGGVAPGSPITRQSINLFSVGTPNEDILDLEEGRIFISPEYFENFGMNNRSAGTGKDVFHKYVFIYLFVDNVDDIGYFPISNMTATNAITVEFENGVKVKYNNLTEEEENKQGIKFKDLYNTMKEVDFTVPLLTNLEYNNLHKNFFIHNKDSSFFIFPCTEYNGVSVSPEIFNNHRFGGHYFYTNDYEIDREFNDVYELELKCEECI